MNPQHPSDDADDQRQLQAARAGDAAAFDRLVDRYSGRLFNLALRLTGSAQDAEEIVQETFLSAFQNLPNFRGDSAFGSWVHRIAANFALMRLRHRKVVSGSSREIDRAPEQREEESVLGPPRSAWSRRADEQVLDKELGLAIETAISRLPDEQRTVFLLRDVEGLSYEEIAESTGDSLQAIKSRLHRARLALRHTIDGFYAERGRP